MTPKEANSIVTKWMYPSARKTKSTFDVEYYEHQDVNGPESWRWIPCLDFTCDHGAWDENLYKLAEVRDIEGLFASALIKITGCPTLDEDGELGEGGYIDHISFISMAYIIARATLEQKTIALATAIHDAKMDAIYQQQQVIARRGK